MVPETPTPTKVLFPKETSVRIFEVGEVTVLKDDPLSVDLTMVPESPTPTKVLFPKVTSLYNLLGYPNVEVHTGCNFSLRSGYSATPSYYSSDTMKPSTALITINYATRGQT